MEAAVGGTICVATAGVLDAIRKHQVDKEEDNCQGKSKLHRMRRWLSQLLR